MFNTPIIDVTIGLVFIFLIYSLLATSIQEGISTSFSLRARMLKRSIIESMLSNTPTDERWSRLKSILSGVRHFFTVFFQVVLFFNNVKKENKKIGDLFYDHPLLRNYGSSRIFPHPSYLPSENFSMVLLDVLKNDFNDKFNEIADFKFNNQQGHLMKSEIEDQLSAASDVNKIKELLDFYGHYYSGKSAEIKWIPVIEKDTLDILRMHLQNSIYTLDKFSNILEVWFNDTMNRVSGWYKRQVQVIMFCIGIFLAFVLNIDTIEIVSRLSNDKDLRDQMVKVAVATVEADSNNEKISKEEKFKIDSLKLSKLKERLDKEENDMNQLMGLGWGDYGLTDTNFIKYTMNLDTIDCSVNPYKWRISNGVKAFKKVFPDSIFTFLQSERIKYSVKTYKLIQYNYPYASRIWYLCYKTGTKKMLGFLITAFAICLGAPFWFDLLSKVVKIRSTGKKENGKGIDAEKSNFSSPVTVQVNNQNIEEAIG
jgi:hypothetical protein